MRQSAVKFIMKPIFIFTFAQIILALASSVNAADNLQTVPTETNQPVSSAKNLPATSADRAIKPIKIQAVSSVKDQQVASNDQPAAPVKNPPVAPVKNPPVAPVKSTPAAPVNPPPVVTPVKPPPKVTPVAAPVKLPPPPPPANDISVTVGLRLWANEWQAWDDPYGSSSAAGSFGTANAIAVNPSLTIKYKNIFVSGGFMAPTSYSVPGSSTGETISASRKEMDMSVGYYIHPQVALTLGYKRITQTWGGTDYVWQIPAVGMSTFAPLQGTRMFIYGNAALGYSGITTSDNTATYWGMKGGMYSTGEFGMGYSFSSSYRMTLGYKYQASPTSMEANLSTTRVNFVDYTRGFVLGNSYTF